MSMDVRTMKHAVKLAEWSEKVQACRSSGMTVKEWCKQNQVCCKTYYRWERVYLAEVSKQLAIPNQLPRQTGQLVRIEPDQLRDEARNGMPALPVQTTSNAGITLRYGNISVEMPCGIEIRQVAELMKAVAQLC